MADWTFAIENHNYIDKYSRWFVRSTRLDLQDFKQSLFEDVALSAHKFDSTRAGRPKWIWLRARKVREQLLCREYRHTKAVRALRLLSPPARPKLTMERRLSILRTIQSCTEREATAVQSFVEGWSTQEVRDRMNIGLPRRTELMQRVRARA